MKQPRIRASVVQAGSSVTLKEDGSNKLGDLEGCISWDIQITGAYGGLLFEVL